MQVFLDGEEWKNYQRRVAELGVANPEPIGEPIRFPNDIRALEDMLDENDLGDICIRPDEELFEMLDRLAVAQEKLKLAFEMAEFVSTLHYDRTAEYQRRIAKEIADKNPVQQALDELEKKGLLYKTGEFRRASSGELEPVYAAVSPEKIN